MGLLLTEICAHKMFGKRVCYGEIGKMVHMMEQMVKLNSLGASAVENFHL